MPEIPQYCTKQSTCTLNPTLNHLVYSINSLTPGDAHMHQWQGSLLLQVMPWHLLGTKPLPEPMLTHLSIKSKATNFGEGWIKLQYFPFKKKLSTKWHPFCSGPNLPTTIFIVTANEVNQSYSRCYKSLSKSIIHKILNWNMIHSIIGSITSLRNQSIIPSCKGYGQLKTN